MPLYNEEFPLGMLTAINKHSTGYPVTKFLRNYLTQLHVPFYDVCCPDGITSLPVRYFDGALQQFDGSAWTDIDISGGGGTVPGLQEVIDQNNVLDKNSDIIIGNNDLQFLASEVHDSYVNIEGREDIGLGVTNHFTVKMSDSTNNTQFDIYPDRTALTTDKLFLLPTSSATVVGQVLTVLATSGEADFRPLPTYTPTHVPYANGSGVLVGSNQLTWDGTSLNVGFAGFGGTNTIRINDGRGYISSTGFGLSIGTSGGQPVDPSKSIRFYNSAYQYAIMYSVGTNPWTHHTQFDTTFNVTLPAAIGTATLPNDAAILDLVSTTKGLLLPRMTKTQRDAIASPVAGLAVYQTDNTPGLRVYNGTNWMKYSETID